MFVYRKILVMRRNCSGVPFGLKNSPGQGSMLFYFFKVTDGRISGCWDLKQFCHFVRILSVLFRPLRLLCWTMDANIGFWRMAGCKYLASLCVTHSWLLLPTYYNTSAVPSQCCLCQFWFLHAEHPIPFSIFHVSGIQRWTARLSCLQEAPSLVMNDDLQWLRQVAVLIHTTWWDREETESALPKRDKEASQWGSPGGWKMARGLLWRQEWILAWGNNIAQGSEVCKTA